MCPPPRSERDDIHRIVSLSYRVYRIVCIVRTEPIENRTKIPKIPVIRYVCMYVRMYVCMYAVVVVAAAAIIIVIVLCYWEVRRRVVACGGTVRVGCGCCGFCRYIYIDIDGGSERKDREEKKEKKRKEKKGRIRVCGRGNKP